MPSPFLGMDPYLEDPIIFPDFHDRFVAYLSEAIQAILPEPYYAALGRRAWVEVSERFVGPDVNVISAPSRPQSADARPSTMDVAQPIVVKVPHDEQVETLIEIYVGRGEERRLVTAIEMLSPSNKTPGEKGRDLYLRKQSEILDSKSHLVEIDLLRGGQHTTAVPEGRLRRSVAPYTYHVCAHRYDRFEDYFIYPIGLRQPLPTISIPLLPSDGEVAVALQQVRARTYDAGPYRREIDYRQPVPPPPLSSEDEQWVAELTSSDK